MKKKISLEILLFRIYILIMIFEGAIRYVLNLANLAILIYVKDVIMIVLLLLSFREIKLTKKHMWIAILILIQLTVAMICIDNLNQILFFGLKILLLLIVGILQYKNILNDIKNNTSFYKICYIMVLLGILLNRFVTFPWEGLTYSIGEDIEVTASRSWSTVGNKRLAGFSRSSFNVATQIMLLSLVWQIKKDNKYKKAMNILITFAAIWLTTTKGLLVSYFLVTMLNLKILNKKYIRNILVTACISCMILIPIFSLSSRPIFGYLKSNLESEKYVKWFSSMEDRMVNTWPNALNMIKDNGNIVLGRGLGGIGTAQSIYEEDLYSPADNMFIYLYGTIGVFALLCLCFLNKEVNKLENTEEEERLINSLILIIVSYGIIANILEEPFLCIMFGVCLGYLIKNKKADVIKIHTEQGK